MTRRNITVPDVLWFKLKAAADVKGVSISEIIRAASDAYLCNDTKEVNHAAIPGGLLGRKDRVQE